MADDIAVIDLILPPPIVVDVIEHAGTPGPPGIPGLHAPSHEADGADPITALDASVLTGTLPAAVLTTHAPTHQMGGSDPLTALDAAILTGTAPVNVAAPTSVTVGGGVGVETRAAPVFPTTGLVSYWKLDEASGTRVDSHGTNHLAPTNAPVGAAGKIGNGCDFEADSSQYLSCPDTILLGDEDFTWSLWIKRESIAGTLTHLIAKDTDTGRAFDIAGTSSSLDVYFANNTQVCASTALPADANWHFIVIWHDAAANTASIQIDNGTVISNTTGGAFPGNFPAVHWQFGRRQYPGYEQHFDGLIDEVGLWRRVLTAQERTDLYNGGAGLAYSSGEAPAYVAVGATPAQSGALRLSNNQAIVARNAANTGDVEVITVDATDQILIGGEPVGGGAELPTAPIGQVLVSQGDGVDPVFSSEPILRKNPAPRLILSDESQAVNQRAFHIKDTGSELLIGSVNDDGSITHDLYMVRIDRQGNITCRGIMTPGHVVMDGICVVGSHVRLTATTFPPFQTGIGCLAHVSDSTTKTPGAVISGGGTFHVLAWWNGTNWICIGG